MPGTRKLGKTTDQRMAMLRQQVTDLLDNGKIVQSGEPKKIADAYMKLWS